MVAHACSPSYSRGWGRKIAWTWEVEVMSQDHTTALPAWATEWDSVSKRKEQPGTHHHNRLIFVFSVETEFCPVGQAGLKLLTSSDPPASASQRADRREPLHPAKKTFLYLYALVSSKLRLSLCSLWFLPFMSEASLSCPCPWLFAHI